MVAKSENLTSGLAPELERPKNASGWPTDGPSHRALSQQGPDRLTDTQTKRNLPMGRPASAATNRKRGYEAWHKRLTAFRVEHPKMGFREAAAAMRKADAATNGRKAYEECEKELLENMPVAVEPPMSLSLVRDGFTAEQIKSARKLLRLTGEKEPAIALIEALTTED
jgi:hypothetical protein